MFTDLKALNRTLKNFSAVKYFPKMTDFTRRACVFIAFISNYQGTQLCRSVLIVILTTLSVPLFSGQDTPVHLDAIHNLLTLLSRSFYTFVVKWNNIQLFN